MKLIDLDKALKIVEDYGTSHGTTLGRHSGVADIIHYELSRLPVIEAEPVKYGKWLELWINHGIRYYTCSVCRKNEISRKSHYCPDCGAKMEEKDED